MAQLLIRLPDALARRFKRRVAVRQRSKFIERLLEESLPPEDIADDDPLYQAALAVEKDERLTSEMAEWEEATEARPPIVVATPSAGPRAVAVCDQLRAVDKRRLTRASGRLSASDLGIVEDGVRRVLDL
jgi:hypothetical protein